MNSARVVICHKHRSFSSLPWISPLHFLTPKLDPPPKTLLEPRRKPKFISHETAINLIKHERDPQHALEIFNMVVEQKGFNHNHATYSTIIDKLARAKKFQAVDALLRQMMYETCKFHESLFLNLMKYFAKSSVYERVVEMFNKIQPVVREKPSLKAISTCLNLLVESKQVDLLRGFLLDLKKGYMLKPNTCIFNILIKYHCKSGDLESAFAVVEEMKKGRLKEAIELFEEMVSKDQILPDALTYNVLINGFSCWGKVDRAKKIMEFMKSNGCSPNVFNYSALMSGFCKEGSFGLKQDTVGYTTLINYFCRFGRIDEAMVLLEEMKETKCKADVVTVNVLLRGFCGEGRTEEALGMLNRLSSEGIYLNKASYRIVLNSLCQKGELDKALELLGLTLSRGFLPHHATSNELLVGLCKAGMADDAVVALYGLAEMGFKPEPDSWALLVEFVCRERKLLLGFELLDELTANECENSVPL
ncbi:pentatricopeptide repeat-containing protein [Salix suchowensis]|nr:pentatricopeptide repeat-containing protein [Salix suchowensis]